MSKENLKITKYITRLRNSSDNDDFSKSLKYLQHLKFHVQKGGIINSDAYTGLLLEMNNKVNNNLNSPEQLKKEIHERIKTIIDNIGINIKNTIEKLSNRSVQTVL